jgi:O-antigen/teichoic acid export membrane protein
MAVDAVVFVLGIIVSIVLTRSLGPEQRGVYVVLFTTNVLVAALANFGVTGGLSTMLARGRLSLARASGSALFLAVALGGIFILVVVLLFPMLSGGAFRGVTLDQMIVALLLVPSTIFQAYWNYMMMGSGRVLLLNKVSLAMNVINAVLMVLAVGVLGLGIPGFLAAWTASSVFGLVTMFVVAARIERPELPPHLGSVRALLGFGLRGHGAQVAHHLYLRLDVYALNLFVGNTAVGFYSLSTSLAEKLWVPLNAVHAASAGRVAELPHEEAGPLAAKVSRSAVLLMLAMAVPLALVSPWLIPFLYGAEFSESVLPLVILLGGTVAFGVMIVLNNYIIGQMERPGLLSITAWAQLLVSVPLYVVLISVAGILGAAIASTATYVFAMLVTVVIFSRHSGISPFSALVPRASDFTDYMRVLRPMLRRVPLLGRYARHSS